MVNWSTISTTKVEKWTAKQCFSAQVIYENNGKNKGNVRLRGPLPAKPRLLQDTWRQYMILGAVVVSRYWWGTSVVCIGVGIQLSIRFALSLCWWCILGICSTLISVVLCWYWWAMTAAAILLAGCGSCCCTLAQQGERTCRGKSGSDGCPGYISPSLSFDTILMTLTSQKGRKTAAGPSCSAEGHACCADARRGLKRDRIQWARMGNSSSIPWPNTLCNCLRYCLLCKSLCCRGQRCPASLNNGKVNITILSP